jgi:phosphatidylglycerophosphate synthase
LDEILEGMAGALVDHVSDHGLWTVIVVGFVANDRTVPFTVGVIALLMGAFVELIRKYEVCREIAARSSVTDDRSG